MRTAVAFDNHHLDDLAATGDQLGQCAGLLVGHRAGRQIDRRGAQRVGLGQPAGRVGEVAHLARVDHRQRQAGRAQQRRHRHLKAAGRLQNHQRHIEPDQPLRQASPDSRTCTSSRSFATSMPTNIRSMTRHCTYGLAQRTKRLSGFTCSTGCASAGPWIEKSLANRHLDGTTLIPF